MHRKQAHSIWRANAKQRSAERWELPNLSAGCGYPSLTPRRAAREGKPQSTAPPGAPPEAPAQGFISLGPAWPSAMSCSVQPARSGAAEHPGASRSASPARPARCARSAAECACTLQLAARKLNMQLKKKREREEKLTRLP